VDFLEATKPETLVSNWTSLLCHRFSLYGCSNTVQTQSLGEHQSNNWAQLCGSPSQHWSLHIVINFSNFLVFIFFTFFS